MTRLKHRSLQNTTFFDSPTFSFWMYSASVYNILRFCTVILLLPWVAKQTWRNFRNSSRRRFVIVVTVVVVIAAETLGVASPLRMYFDVNSGAWRKIKNYFQEYFLSSLIIINASKLFRYLRPIALQFPDPDNPGIRIILLFLQQFFSDELFVWVCLWSMSCSPLSCHSQLWM